jgi:ABC-2 type transport system permease protein
MRSFLTLIRIDLAIWRRTPWVIATALIPPIGMAILVTMLTLAVTRQPVALVVQDHSAQAQVMKDIIQSDTDTYQLYQTNLAGAKALLRRQEVTSIIVIPKGFGTGVGNGHAKVDLTLNNIDYDFADDVRRSIARSVAEYDAPELGVASARTNSTTVVPNPYRIDIAENDLRKTDVDFLHYQVVPVLLLLIINVGLLSSAVLSSRDRERKTDRVLALAPVSPMARVTARLVGGLLTTFAVVIPVTWLLVLTHQIAPTDGHWLALIGVLGITGLLSVSLGSLLGVALKRATTVAVAAVILASYLFFLGGGFTTIAFLPAWLREVSRIIPTRYAINALRQCLFYPNLASVASNLLTVTAFALAALVASVVVLRRAAR